MRRASQSSLFVTLDRWNSQPSSLATLEPLSWAKSAVMTFRAFLDKFGRDALSESTTPTCDYCNLVFETTWHSENSTETMGRGFVQGECDRNSRRYEKEGCQRGFWNSVYSLAASCSTPLQRAGLRFLLYCLYGKSPCSMCGQVFLSRVRLVSLKVSVVHYEGGLRGRCLASEL